MKLSIVLRSPVSARPYADDLFCLPVAGVPFTLGALRLRMLPYWYITPDDYARGRSLLAELGAGLLMGCTTEITNAVNRLTALFDSTFNGNARALTGTGTPADPYVYDPPLPVYFDNGSYTSLSARQAWEITAASLNAEVNGAPSGWGMVPSIPQQQRQAIIDALAAMGADSDEVEELLQLMLIALG